MTALVYTILAIPFFIFFAWLARRLLGVRSLSAVKTIAAALLGLFIGDVIGIILHRGGLETDLAIVVSLILGLVFTMVAILGFEAVAARDPRARRPSLWAHPIRTTRRLTDQGRRSIEITRIASRHGLGKGFGLAASHAPEDAAAYGADLRAAFEEAGGVFVKLGQLLATRTDLIPVETAEQLAKLHQDVEPAPRPEIEPALRRALGSPVDEVFPDFDWEPIGAASIGQVYRAALADGEPVVVKVRRPDVEETVERDLAIALDLAAFAEQRSEQARRLGVHGVADQFADQLRAEMDYRIEARNTEEAAAALADQRLIVVPKVHDELSSETVLVQQLIPGETLGRRGVIGGPQGRILADALFRGVVDAMLAGQRFHADPHPGNVLITPENRLGMIDFGSAGRLDDFERAAVTDILTALALDDPTMLRTAALQVGMGEEEVDPSQLDRAFARMMADHLGPGAEPSAELLEDFLDIVNRFGLTMPTSVTEMLRALATLQGSLELLSPGYPIVDAARGLASDRLEAELTPENLTEDVKREVIRLAPMLRRAPYHLDRLADQLERGRLTVRVSMFSSLEDVRVVSTLVNRAVLALVGATLGIVSAMLFQIDGGPSLSDNFSLFDLLGFIGLFSGVILIMRVVMEILRER